MFRSATFKLTAYYLAIIAIISIGFSFALYQIGTNDLAFGLHRQMQRISTDFPVFSGSPYLHSGHELSDGDKHLLQRLIAFNILVIAVAGFASYALARRTLLPIETAHERQKRFTADVSHELRTPLTALKMESEVALLDPAAPKAELRAALASNVEEADKLTTLIKNLLRLSQLEASDAVGSMTTVELGEAAREAVSQLAATAQKRRITLHSNISAELPVLADHATLVQLLIILLDNAIKYSPEGSEVIVKAEAQQQLAKISISDPGIGIAKDDLEHVFERFYRADAARSANTTNGFGIGLSIAKLIADSHDATISLTSQPGKGTTATLLMPLVAESPKVSVKPAAAPPKA